MGKIVEKKKKKKGRPSLLDIQKRNLRLQKEEEEQQNQNQKTTTNPTRRFTRRNPDPDVIAHSDDDDDNEGDDSKPNRREKKLNSVNSPYLDLGLYGSDSNEDDDETPLKKKRKINAVGGSAQNAAKKQQQQQQQNSKATEKHLSSLSAGTPSESGPTGTTPLPDKKLLVFILDRLQKKDTYGVYSEPVDPEELPDYLEIVDNPMDFGTVRQKLEDGAYATLEQFESDVFLISSNAMQYNAPDTIYFRQARTIHELAKKDFQNLRQDSDTEQGPKIVRRGRPPKKPLVNTSSEREGLDVTLTKSGDNAVWSNSYNLRRGRVPDKYIYADSSRRTPYGSRNNESYSWLSEHKFDKNDGFSGSSMKGFYSKYGNKQSVLDESRRNTYITSHPVVGSESSVLSTFDGEIKQLLPVGLHTEHGYARSLARFAANLGPVAWKMASKKIERALPPGMKFGPGWIGDDEAPSVRIPSLATSSKCPMQQEQPISSTQISSSAAVPHMVESSGDILLKQNLMNRVNNLPVDGHPNRAIPSAVASSTILSRSPEPIAEPLETAVRFVDGGFGLMSNGGSGIRPPFQVHEGALMNPSMNGFTGGFGACPSSQMGKAVGPAVQTNSIDSDVSVHSRILDMVSKSNFINSKPSNHSEMYLSNVSGSSSTVNTSSALMPNSIPEAQAGTRIGLQAQAYWNGLLASQIPGSVPPDLNTRFQSPGSPNPSVRVDSSQPDLALQL